MSFVTTRNDVILPNFPLAILKAVLLESPAMVRPQ
jgi:hypothetical protein